jgi:hypothetical protein
LANPFTSLEGAIVGGGIGIAVSTAAEPVFEPGRQAVWRSNPYAILIPEVLAMLVAQGLVPFDAAAGQAKGNGLDGNKFRALVETAKTAPGLGELDRMLRRDSISVEQLTHGFAKHQIEPQYWDALHELRFERLDPAVVALAIVRGIIADPGFLPVGPPAAVGKVPAFPTSPLVGVDEAKAHGWTKERLFVQTAISGRPMGPEAAASAVFRNIIERVDYARAVAEGDVRNEWADAIFEQARQIPSAANFVAGHIRGWIDEGQMHDGAARHGMRDADTDLLFKIQGRPLTWHQVWIGLQRGGTYDGPIDAIDPAFLHSLRQSDIRPEWYNLAWHSRYTYPSAFVMRALTQDGTLTAAQAEADLLDMGWRPERAKQAAEKWAGGGTAARDPHVVKAENQLWTTLHTSYKNGESDAADAEAGLDVLGVPQGVHARIIALWNHERALVRKQLTPTQLKKAWKGATVNPATGVAWTRDEALVRLEATGYSPADAETFLDE